ncbi:hypothetical protein [Brevibacillus laterosporus]|uniref:hypothetical protein n=1 Tax=Brevibacillus laterosporus TaxID=1465 RepID=UPI003D19A892
MTTVVRGLDNILSGGTEFITFEENKPRTLLFIDWGENLSAIREHYETSLNPKYIRCPGKDVCPLCYANPGKYPALRIKFRVFDPTDNKVKMVSLAKSHIQKLNADFNLDEVDPTKSFVTIHRTGKGASDTSYSARQYKANPDQGKPEYALPNPDDMNIPDIAAQLTPHSPDEISGIMNALLANMGNQGGSQGQNFQAQGNTDQVQGGQQAPRRTLPF